MPYKEGQEVRVKALLEPRHWECHGADAAKPTSVGDIGLVVDVDATSGHMIYTVECIGIHGEEKWLTEFVDEELEPIPPRDTAARADA